MCFRATIGFKTIICNINAIKNLYSFHLNKKLYLQTAISTTFEEEFTITMDTVILTAKDNESYYDHDDCANERADFARHSEAISDSLDERNNNHSAETLKESKLELNNVELDLLIREPHIPGFRLLQPKSFPAPVFGFVVPPPDDTPIRGDLLNSRLLQKTLIESKLPGRSEIMVLGCSGDNSDNSGCYNHNNDLLPETSHSFESINQPECVEDKVEASDSKNLEPYEGTQNDAKKQVFKKQISTGDPVICKITAGVEAKPLSVAEQTECSNTTQRPHNQLETQIEATQCQWPHNQPDAQIEITLAVRLKRSETSNACTQDIKHALQSQKAVSKEKKTAIVNLKINNGTPPSSHSITKKRQITSKSDCMSSNTVKKKKKGMVVRKYFTKPAEKSKLKGKKQSVLPRALLNQIVKTVQENLKVFAQNTDSASVAKPSFVADFLETKPVSTVSVSECSKIDGVASLICLETCTGSHFEMTHNKPETRLVNCMLESQEMVNQVTIDQNNSYSEGTNQDHSDELEYTYHEISSKLSDTNREKASDNKIEVEDVETQPGIQAQTLEGNLSLCLPIECVEKEVISKSDASNMNLKKQAKNQRKSQGQRNSSEGDCHMSLSPLGILPEYIPENDSRINKKKEDKVYNLSALFSGTFGAGVGDSQPPGKKRPNYFLAVQITSQEIKSGLLEVQKKVAEEEPRLKPAFVPVDKTHLTLGVMLLSDEEAINRAKAGMDEFQISWQEDRQQQRQQQEKQEQQQKEESGCHLTLEVKGLGHFRNSVVFAKVTEGTALDLLKAIAVSLRSSLENKNITFNDEHFEPHVTIMKLSKNLYKLKKAGIKKISSKLFEADVSRGFGSDTVTNIQLCSMLKPAKNKYYHIEYEVSLNTGCTQ